MSLSNFDAGWVVGFIESEGVFTTNTIKFGRKTKSGLKKYRYQNPAFYLVSRDRSALEAVRGLLRAGKVNRHGAIFHLDIRRKDESVRLAEFLDGKLKSEFKARQFETWKGRVLEWKSRAWGAGVSQGGKKGQARDEGSQSF